MSVRIIVINGAPGAGKTTFEHICQNLCDSFEDENLKVEIYSTVDFVKYLAALSGWDGTKTPKNRKFLSDLKDLLTEWNDIPFKKIEEAAREKACDRTRDWILLVDCREPKEIQKLKERLDATTVFIQRESVEGNETSNHADANVYDFDYDIYINNNGSLQDLEYTASEFLDNLLI